MSPVFEHAFVDALGMMQIRAPIIGNAIPEDVMMAALDHMNGVDLHITEMLDRGLRGLRAVAERRLGIEPLGAQPDRSGCGLGQSYRLIGRRHRAAI